MALAVKFSLKDLAVRHLALRTPNLVPHRSRGCEDLKLMIGSCVGKHNKIQAWLVTVFPDIRDKM